MPTLNAYAPCTGGGGEASGGAAVESSLLGVTSCPLNEKLKLSLLIGRMNITDCQFTARQFSCSKYLFSLRFDSGTHFGKKSLDVQPINEPS
jgi:hypothetical protein